MDVKLFPYIIKTIKIITKLIEKHSYSVTIYPSTYLIKERKITMKDGTVF
jgi:hypothetical protein